MSEDGPVLDPDEFDIEDDERVREIGEDRYVVSASDQSPVPPADASQTHDTPRNTDAPRNTDTPPSGTTDAAATANTPANADAANAGSHESPRGNGGGTPRGTDSRAPSGGAGGRGSEGAGGQRPRGAGSAGGERSTDGGANGGVRAGNRPTGSRGNAGDRANAGGGPPGTRDPPTADEPPPDSVRTADEVPRGAPGGARRDGRREAASGAAGGPDSAAVSRWLADSLRDDGFAYGFDVTVSMDGEVSRHRTRTDDVTDAFETLAVWFARNASDGDPERALGVLLSAADTSVELPPSVVRRAAVEHDLSADDSIGELLEAVRAEGYVRLD